MMMITRVESNMSRYIFVVVTHKLKSRLLADIKMTFVETKYVIKYMIVPQDEEYKNIWNENK